MRFTASTEFSELILIRWSAPSCLPKFNLESRVPVRITGCAPNALATATPSARSGDDHTFPGDQAAKRVERVHRRAGGYDQRGFLVAKIVRHVNQGIDVVHGIFGKAPVGGEAVGTVALVVLAVIHAVVDTGCVHARAAFAAPATEVDFHRDAIADLIFVDPGPELDHGAHIFVARREVLVERRPALDQGGRPARDRDVAVANATAWMRISTSAGPGCGTGFSVNRSCPGSSRTQACMVEGDGNTAVLVAGFMIVLIERYWNTRGCYTSATGHCMRRRSRDAAPECCLRL